jgi:hypothetical protein
MNIGMMWYDNDPKETLEAKIQRAADFYLKKHGVKPNFCFVNPGVTAQFGGGELHVGSITLRPMRAVLPGHLWIGVDEKGANDGHTNL